jgi:hypothetical protein
MPLVAASKFSKDIKRLSQQASLMYFPNKVNASSEHSEQIPRRTWRSEED